MEIEGILAGGFSECSGLQVETEFLDYREGGSTNTCTVSPDRPNIRRSSQARADPDRRTVELASGCDQGKIERKNGTIYLLDKQRMPVMWWDFKEAFPVKWTGPELRADSAEVAIRKRRDCAPRLEPADAWRYAWRDWIAVAGAIGGSIGL